MHDVDKHIQLRCLNSNCYNYHAVTVYDVQQSLKHLKKRKRDGLTDCESDNFINATPKLSIYLSMLFSSMIKHRYAPSDMLISTIVPIPKNKHKSMNYSDNYRAIALSSVLGKLLESIILYQNKSVFSTSDYQFGFKVNHSTTSCSFVVQEVINYYKTNHSDAFVMFLDASKAFDKVHYCKLFQILLDKGLCPLTCSFLANMYTHQKLRVKWGKSFSNLCTVTNGVKQGGVLSPVLFTMYIDKLLIELKNSGYGCYIGTKYMGSFSYADDIVIITPSQTAMRLQLEICDEFSSEYSISFNPDKYQLLHYTQSSVIEGMFFNGIFIKSAKSANHLGITLNIDNKGSCVKNITDMFYVNVNSLKATFPNVSREIKYKLFKTFCMSVYGSSLWDCSSKTVNTFLTAWRKSIRYLLQLPYKCRSIYLPLICNDLPVDVQLHSRF